MMPAEPGSDPVAVAIESSRGQLEALLALIEADHRSLTAVRDPAGGWRAHVLDSLAGLLCPALITARRLADIGAGAGFPGLALALALPQAQVDLIESVTRKCDFMTEAIAGVGIGNATPRCIRAEDWARSDPPAGGRDAYDAVCARAVGPLPLLVELASPLLAADGRLIAWKGRPDDEELAVAAAVAEQVAMTPEPAIDVAHVTGYDNRLLCVYRKSGPTPASLPRRTGLARKRPLARAE